MEAYWRHTLTEGTGRNWFIRFQNSDFNTKDKERHGKPQKCEGEDFEAILNNDSWQTLKEYRGNYSKTRLPHISTPRDIERRLCSCEQLLQ